ncbi:Uncharacterised protein [Escherichia coli]|nr:Uncharacterised protein [Escherichia coli]
MYVDKAIELAGTLTLTGTLQKIINTARQSICQMDII